MITKVGEVILSFALLNQIFEDWHFKNTINWVKNSIALHTIKHRLYMPWTPSYQCPVIKESLASLAANQNARTIVAIL